MDVRAIKTKFDRNPAYSYVINGKNVTKAEAVKAVKDNNLKLVETINTNMHAINIYK